MPWQGERSVTSAQTYGTGRIAAGELFVVTLNKWFRRFGIRDPVTDRYFVNTETIAAREKQQALKEKTDLVIADSERVQAVGQDVPGNWCQCSRTGEFDGSNSVCRVSEVL